ncbi:hypothetical protein FLONG3_7787 [Fusarium longipes]|uniref:Uncharacterized protein n=1 Tax=Fusarium longipes TaxID=694270 RepID=A0A395SAE9_9HYPO|nr:hypothetical protein FLONG3_7787 [Fusarium longipes]
MSLHELSVQNPWFPAHPLYWSSKHYELLGCKFQQRLALPEINVNANEQEADLNKTSNAECATILASDAMPYMKDEAARKLFECAGGPLEPFSCRGTTRRFRVRLDPKWGFNSPVIRKRQCKLKGLQKDMPKEWWQDPYLLCVLLSLAQSIWYEDLLSKIQYYPVRLLLTNNDDTENAHILYAEFPDDILKGIRRATHRITADWPTIYHTTIPLKPYETFYDRLINEALGGVKNEKQAPDVVVKPATEDLPREMNQIEWGQIECNQIQWNLTERQQIEWDQIVW